MEPLTSIASLIYASTGYASHLWDMLRRTTPELQTGEAEFFFVANDATAEVLRHLRAHGIPYVIQRNPRLTESELHDLGFGRPEYIRRVYQGWNRAVLQARADCLVLLNSDHVLLPGWLSALRDRWHPDLALSPLTVEPGGSHGVFGDRRCNGTGAEHGEHGRTLDDFDSRAFGDHALELKRDVTTPGGVYMPVMVRRAAVLDVGGYPEGNIHAGRFDKIAEYGDQRLFRLLAERGVEHRTYHGTVAYHFQEGEMREAEAA